MCDFRTVQEIFLLQKAHRCLFEVESLEVCLILSASSLNKKAPDFHRMLQKFGFFGLLLVADGQFITSFSAARCKHAAAISRCHAGSETMLICPFTAAGLKCLLH